MVDGATSSQLRSAPPVNLSLLRNTEDVLLMTPAYPLMRRDANLQDWSKELRRFGERESLRPIAGALDYVASHASTITTTGPFREALVQHCADLQLSVLFEASDTAMESPNAPYASFMLAWVALYLWILSASRRGENLFDDGPWDGWPNPGWLRISATCLEFAAKLNGLYGARLFAELSWEVLETNRRRRTQHHEQLQPHLARYRALLQRIESAHSKAIANLVDDLRDACVDRGSRARTLVCVLLWSLGLVPECLATRAATGAPSRRMLTLAIERSIDCAPSDPLIQYMWLEMKEVPGLDVRSHEALYTLFNHNWGQWSLDDLYEAYGLRQPASRLYVRALESVLAESADSRAADEFLSAYELIGSLPHTLPPRAFIGQRLHMLRHLIAERFNYYDPDFTEAQRAEYLKGRIDEIARAREQIGRYPDMPDMLGRRSQPCFSLIESYLGNGTKLPLPERDRCILAIDAVESFRAGALAYWLRINPPLPPAVLSPNAAPLLEAEKEGLANLRGAFFLTMRPTLPMHFMWSDMEIANLLELDNSAQRTQFYSPDRARGEMQDVERSLSEIANRVQRYIPEYAARRLKPRADFEQLVSVLNRHTCARSAAP